MKNIKKPKYLGSKTNIDISPNNFELDCISNPHKDQIYSIRFSAPEFTSICPVTSQPDFGQFIIDYVPNRTIVESKSLKLFLFSFRHYGGFHEDCTIKVAKKIIKYASPRWIRVASFWNPRGGIPLDIIFQKGKKPINVHIQELNIPIYSGR
tara:strand:- start:74 stop:529 length:456 start_codon:yes stop_codon:yes gene_type:complete